MKTSGVLTLTLSLSMLAGAVKAAEVREDADSNVSHGKSLGGMNGMMIGAIGGPIGMLIGAGVGMLVGDGAEEVAENTLSSSGKPQPAESSTNSSKTVTR
ncbi:hypothetical protein [Azotobacter salinestris]|uniref:hypothetical protein n=1 Tax=Azotobacter salinestris TaxID=69964 RepID=UPI001FCC038F|nr:hypothetical protein [Azotobacter salinestris]